jgi:hypothetical protein
MFMGKRLCFHGAGRLRSLRLFHKRLATRLKAGKDCLQARDMTLFRTAGGCANSLGAARLRLWPARSRLH